MKMTYLTYELKTNDEGGTASDTLYSGIDLHMAEKKYYEALSIATTSGRPMHSAMIVRGDGAVVRSYGYVNVSIDEGDEQVAEEGE